MTELGRLLDSSELDQSEGRRGRLKVDVLPEWLLAGDTVEVVIPARLTCGRCGGGGCDPCDRSGALRLDDHAADQTLRVTLPVTTSARVLVRLVRPLGDDADLEQLSLELRASSEPSSGCRRLTPPSASASGLTTRTIVMWLAILLLCALALALALAQR